MTDETTAPAEGEAPAAAEAPAAPAAPEEPELTPEQKAALQAHSDVNDAEQGWSGRIEGRLAAIEEHLGIGDSANNDEKETS